MTTDLTARIRSFADTADPDYPPTTAKTIDFAVKLIERLAGQVPEPFAAPNGDEGIGLQFTVGNAVLVVEIDTDTVTLARLFEGRPSVSNDFDLDAAEAFIREWAKEYAG